MISECLAVEKLEMEEWERRRENSPWWISCNYSIVTAASDNMPEADYKAPRAVPGEHAEGTSHTVWV